MTTQAIAPELTPIDFEVNYGEFIWVGPNGNL